MKKKLVPATIAFGTLLLSVVVPTIVSASTASGASGTGTASVTLTSGSLNFVAVPDYNFGSHTITASMTGLTQTSPVTSDLTIEDYRGLTSSATGAGYHVTAAVVNGENGFVGASSGKTLTTANVSVSLGDSSDGYLLGNSAPDITTTNIIAQGTAGQALGQKSTDGGTASIDITNGSLIADTYGATVNYTLVAGI